MKKKIWFIPIMKIKFVANYIIKKYTNYNSYCKKYFWSKVIKLNSRCYMCYILPKPILQLQWAFCITCTWLTSIITHIGFCWTKNREGKLGWRKLLVCEYCLKRAIFSIIFLSYSFGVVFVISRENKFSLFMNKYHIKFIW